MHIANIHLYLEQFQVQSNFSNQNFKGERASSAQEEFKLIQEALDKAVAYYEKLKPTCVDTGITCEDRVKRREAEMQSLQEALKILSGSDVDVA